MAYPRNPQPLRQPRPQYRTGALGLPHPSWRQAVGGVAQPDDRALRSAAEFWEALGL